LPSSAKDTPTPVVDHAPSVQNLPSDEDKLPSRISRSRSGGRHDKKVVPPPQVVTVEMTNDEQRIYAMMGISPMVLASSDAVLDPRSVTIAVRAPGESAPGDAGLTLGGAALTKDAVPTASVDAQAQPDDSVDEAPPAPRRVKRVVDAPVSVAPPEVIAPLESTGQDPDAMPPAADNGNIPAPEGSPDVRRRRRRRSSASDNGSDD
jgi:ribonuclease E